MKTCDAVVRFLIVFRRFSAKNFKEKRLFVCLCRFLGRKETEIGKNKFQWGFAYGIWEGAEIKKFQKNRPQVGFIVENVRRGHAIFDRFSAKNLKKKILFVCVCRFLRRNETKVGKAKKIAFCVWNLVGC